MRTANEGKHGEGSHQQGHAHVVVEPSQSHMQHEIAKCGLTYTIQIGTAQYNAQKGPNHGAALAKGVNEEKGKYGARTSSQGRCTGCNIES